MSNFFLIHTCPQRMWYVQKYLMPSLYSQGVKEIDAMCWNDETGIGNLQSFINSIYLCERFLLPDVNIWHLQDDVILSRDFFSKASAYYEEDIVCGFFNGSLDASTEEIVTAENMWWSFPCIRIPNWLNHEFISWVNWHRKNDFFMSVHIQGGKHDDFLFRHFLLQEHPAMKIRQLIPNIVDHVDFLLGGSTQDRNRETVRAGFFPDADLVEDLKHELSKGC